MFLFVSGIVALLTFLFLVRTASMESKQRGTLEMMNKQIESQDCDLYTGDSRLPNG